MKDKIRKIIVNNKGNVMVIVAFAMVMLIVCVALVVDISLAYTSKAQYQNALDVSAIAGAQDLQGGTDGELDLATAIATARATTESYLLSNKVAPEELNNAVIITIPPEGNFVEIDAAHEVEFYFAKVIGIDSATINVHTKVVVGPLKSIYKKMRPFGLTEEEVSQAVLGETTNLLKVGSGDGSSGDFGFVVLGAHGASVANENVLNGYDGTVTVGDILDVENGNIVSVVANARDYINSLAPDHPDRIWPIPIVEIIDKNHFKVVGFAMFFVEEIEGNGAQTKIYGKFVDWTANGEVDITIGDTGVTGWQLKE
jgi:hypothetical protein